MKKILLTLFLCLSATALLAQDVVIDKLLPGRLGITVLRQVNSFDDVRSLTILSGKADEDDLKLLQNDFPYLRKLDLKGLDCEYIKNASFNFGKKDSLSTLILPQNLRVVPSKIIDNCKKVESIDIPASVLHISNNAFSGTNLSQITLHEGLLTIGGGAFGNCSKLEQITLPSTLLAADNPFNYCDKLKDITSLAPAPPYIRCSDGYTILGYTQENLFTILHTPPCSNYGASKAWSTVKTIQDIDMEPVKDIRVTDVYVPYPFPQNQPNVTLGVGMDSIYINSTTHYYQEYAGRMTVTGDGTLTLGRYNHELDIMGYYSGSGYGTTLVKNHNANNLSDPYWPSLVAKSPVTATDVSVTHRYHLLHGRKYKYIYAFTSLPFDIRLSDLVTEGEGLQWSIMKYSGRTRANASFDEVWVRQTADSTIHAGEGFIVAVGWNRTVTPQASIRYTAPTNQRTAIFNTENAVIPLHDYEAEYECDRGWNFVGNPYPCHFATKYFDLTSPFTVYDNGRYKTYSPIDDDYVLKPFEGFFIQKPWGHDALTLYKEGRFLSCEDYANFKKQNNAPRHAMTADRKVINIVLTQGDEEQDRTRLVINSEATANYEPMSDAVKFPAIDVEQPQLWLTGHDGSRYAISEQPLQGGERIALDLFIATEGDYTLDFDGKELNDLLLTDLETGATQPLAEPYSFHATAGSCNGRFHISKLNSYTYQDGEVTIDGIKYKIYKSGTASVQEVITDAETIDIPAHITYEGATYIVYEFYCTTNDVTYKHLILPETTLRATNVRRGNPKTLETVTIKSLCPPYGSYSANVRDTTDNYTWYVPKAAVNRYKSSQSYRNLPHILPMVEEPQELWAHYGLVQFDDNTKPHNKPALYTYQNYANFSFSSNESEVANIEVEGSQTMHLGRLEYFIHYPFQPLAINNNTSSRSLTPTLINTSPMTADQVVTQYKTGYDELTHWPMLCLPYDLRPGDITSEFDVTIPSLRRYDGARRAANGAATGLAYGSATNWTPVGSGEVIPAGEGFMISAYVSPWVQYASNQDRLLTLPALDNNRRNGIFDTSRTITLTDHPSARAEDRGWNLVGNTYPAYYDMSESDLSSPYIVWGNKTTNTINASAYHYYAFTRDDDDFLLMPFQAFFVQYTDTQREIHLPGSGRYHNYTDFKSRRPAKAPHLKNTDAPVRHLFDIELTGCEQHDRTRVVLNEAASPEFDPTSDVVQISVADASLLCTIDGGQRYTINERPMPQGGIALGLDIVTEGDYTLSLGKTNSSGIILTDWENGRTTRLDEADYTFHATTGNHDTRFTLSFEGLTHIGDFTMRRTAATLYDLQGRPVTGRPAKGIYIENGKKVVVK